MKTIVENPEVGKVYLIRRFLGGPLANRFQPAIVVSRELRQRDVTNPDDFENILEVRWLSDLTQTEIVGWYLGAVRELNSKWLRDAQRRANEALVDAQDRVLMLDALARGLLPDSTLRSDVFQTMKE
jgi:hypothetical protein